MATTRSARVKTQDGTEHEATAVLVDPPNVYRVTVYGVVLAATTNIEDEMTTWEVWIEGQKARQVVLVQASGGSVTAEVVT